MVENKEIVIRFNSLESIVVRIPEFYSLKNEVSQIKENLNSASKEDLFAKVDTISEITDEINKSFLIIRNSQTRLEMKTVKIETELINFKTSQELRLNGSNQSTMTELNELRDYSNSSINKLKNDYEN